MFDNIGGKIKGVSVLITIIGIIASVVGGILIVAMIPAAWGFALLAIAVGSLVSWVGSFLLYGFGELIYRVTAIEKRMLQMSTTILAQEPEKKQTASEEQNVIF